MKEKLTRYCIETDGLVEVTQQWIDAAQRRLYEFASQRDEVLRILNRPYVDETNICKVPKS